VKKKLVIFYCSACFSMVMYSMIRPPKHSHMESGSVPPRSEPTPNFRWIFLRVQLAHHVTHTILRRCCAPCVFAVTSRCTPVCVSIPAHFSTGYSVLRVSGAYCCFCWTKRKQRTPLCIRISFGELGFDILTRVNIQSHSFREMVSQGMVIR